MGVCTSVFIEQVLGFRQRLLILRAQQILIVSNY